MSMMHVMFLVPHVRSPKHHSYIPFTYYSLQLYFIYLACTYCFWSNCKHYTHFYL